VPTHRPKAAAQFNRWEANTERRQVSYIVIFLEASMNFSDGLKILSSKGIYGPHVNLTKRRAIILLGIINDLGDFTANQPEKMQDDYCALLQWLTNQIDKRWARFDLFK